MATELTIGALSKQAGVGIQTVRYYERRGLLGPAGRTDSGYRLFSPEAARMIRFIKNAQGLGFSLDEIARLLKLRVGQRAHCVPVRRQAEARLKIVEEKIAGLRAMEKALSRLIRTCSTRGTTGSCPMLESLEDGRSMP
jgi:DNA-binding transcriptional MerR regulator